MNTRLIAILVGCAFLVSACAGLSEMAAKARAEELAKNQHTVAALRNRCVQYGFKEGTESFAQCLQNEIIAYNQQVVQVWAARSANTQQMEDRNKANQNEQDEQFRTLRKSRPIQTNCMSNGFQTTCTSQ